jgi:hypothetical protein
VVFSVKVWRTVSLMWTGTESVKGDRIVLYRMLRMCGVWAVIMSLVSVAVIMIVNVTVVITWNMWI